jgi:hypothetical protein
MSKKGETIIKKGQVESVRDTADGLRIKVRLQQDGNLPSEELPYCFPLLPKTFQSVPKEGEGAFVIATISDNKESQRYYLGPIISQPQYNEKCEYQDGRGVATSLLDGGTVGPLEKISNYKETSGAFPNVNDVAVVGRGREDIILKYDKTSEVSEIDLRAGIKGGGDNNVGNIIFNNIDPAYIQLKYKAGIGHGEKKEGNSVINMVADRINIMSNRDSNVNSEIHNPNQLVNEEKINTLMDNLHQVPMGDKLVELLEIMKGAIMHHVHPWAGMEQCGDWPGYIKKLDGYDIKSILSEYVRIS